MFAFGNSRREVKFWRWESGGEARRIFAQASFAYCRVYAHRQKSPHFSGLASGTYFFITPVEWDLVEWTLGHLPFVYWIEFLRSCYLAVCMYLHGVFWYIQAHLAHVLKGCEKTDNAVGMLDLYDKRKKWKIDYVFVKNVWYFRYSLWKKGKFAGISPWIAVVILQEVPFFSGYVSKVVSRFLAVYLSAKPTYLTTKTVFSFFMRQCLEPMLHWIWCNNFLKLIVDYYNRCQSCDNRFKSSFSNMSKIVKFIAEFTRIIIAL